MTCKKEIPKEIAYYQFTSEDNQRLLPYTEGQVLKFRNQNNEERTMSISAVEKFKEIVRTGGMGLYTTRFFYDKKDIVVFDSTMGRFFTICFSRYPLDFDLAKEDGYTKYPSKFHGSMHFFPFWNGFEGGISRLYIEYEQRKIEMTINEKTYKDVFVIASGNNSIIEFKPRDRIYYMDVDIVYYDEIEGIIGFNDLNDNKWKLCN
jgi:hypothetical protein